ncbi:thioesterase II family protein [Streptomyces sp. SudanB182_2057]|uniref:thioesterase II family protein n=1 Tax=Streptomyces sp. SudanB182_2057 TaxID=3035281 RepID=UPI003F5545E0
MVESRWLRTFAPRPEATAQLVCFPYAGGAASAFRDWVTLLPPSVELIAVQYPGRQDRIADPPLPALVALADHIAAEITPRLRRPTAFFGHSMGATVAFETARRLRPRYPSPLAHLFVSASKAPFERRPADLEVLDDEALRAYLRSLGRADATVLEDEEVWRMALPTLRHDFDAIRGYEYAPGSPLSCPVTAITGDRDETVSPADAARWAKLTVGSFEIQVLPGGHFYFDDALTQLARVLLDWDTGRERSRC